MNSIYLCKPINKTAGIVTSQKDCQNELSELQIRENLSSIAKQLNEKIIALPKKSIERKELSKKYFEINLQICAMKKKINYKNIDRFIIDVVRENISNFEFNRFLEIAKQRQKNFIESGINE